MSRRLPPPTSGPSVAAYFAVALLVTLVLALILLTVNHGLLGHAHGLRQALGLGGG
ncbi:MAG: hypothetical protein ACREOL_10260 [Candidatus Dormibacteria bacterium]